MGVKYHIVLHFKAKSTCINEKPYLGLETFQAIKLLLERVFGETIHEHDHTMWEVMLSQPANHLCVLHVWSCCHIQDQVSQLLPVSACNSVSNLST